MLWENKLQMQKSMSDRKIKDWQMNNLQILTMHVKEIIGYSWGRNNA